METIPAVIVFAVGIAAVVGRSLARSITRHRLRAWCERNVVADAPEGWDI